MDRLACGLLRRWGLLARLPRFFFLLRTTCARVWTRFLATGERRQPAGCRGEISVPSGAFGSASNSELSWTSSCFAETSRRAADQFLTIGGEVPYGASATDWWIEPRLLRNDACGWFSVDAPEEAFHGRDVLGRAAEEDVGRAALDDDVLFGNASRTTWCSTTLPQCCGSPKAPARAILFSRPWSCGASRLRVSTTTSCGAGAISAPLFAPKFVGRCAASRA